MPSCLLYDSDLFDGANSFRAICRLQVNGKIPQLPWKQLLPPVWYKAWQAFLTALKHSKKSSMMDDYVARILPIFATGFNRLPFRTLNKDEVIHVSGLSDHMSSVLSVANFVTEAAAATVSTPN